MLEKFKKTCKKKCLTKITVIRWAAIRAYIPPYDPARNIEGSITDVASDPAITPAKYINKTRFQVCIISNGIPNMICTVKFTNNAKDLLK